MTIDDLKRSIPYKKLPLVTLDERWYQLFPENEKSSEMKKLEKNLNDLIKKQGQVNNDLKAVRKIKNDLMEQIIQNIDADGLTDSKRQKLMSRNQRLILEAKEKIAKLEDEEMDIPEEIRLANLALVMEGVQISYNKIRANYDDIQLLGKMINEMRIELKKNVLIKQDKEAMNQHIYSYMHDLLGPEVMEVFDAKSDSK